MSNFIAWIFVCALTGLACGMLAEKTWHGIVAGLCLLTALYISIHIAGGNV